MLLVVGWKPSLLRGGHHEAIAIKFLLPYFMLWSGQGSVGRRPLSFQGLLALLLRCATLAVSDMAIGDI